MADKSIGAGQFADDGRQDPAGDHQHLIAASIAVAVVERLKVVDIQVRQGKGRSTVDTGGRFMENRAVAREPGQGIGVQRSLKPAEAEAHPLRDFVRAVGHGDIVVHAERRPIQIIDPNIPYQDDQREPSQEGIGRNSLARVSAERPFVPSAANTKQGGSCTSSCMARRSAFAVTTVNPDRLSPAVSRSISVGSL